MTARTYTAAEMRKAFFDGRYYNSTSEEANAEAERRWPDPAPEPPAMTVREEPDPHGPGIRWRWMPQKGLQIFDPGGCANWSLPEQAWFGALPFSPERLALWADILAFPMRLPDGRPCTLTGEAKP